MTGPHSLWNPQGRICSFPIQASGGCWHSLICGCSTSVFVSDPIASFSHSSAFSFICYKDIMSGFKSMGTNQDYLLNSKSLITSADTFPYKVEFIGFRDILEYSRGILGYP